MLLMTMKGVAPAEVTMAHIFRAVMRFVVMSVLMLVLVFFVPAVAVWLPQMLG
jgi:TRAP-type mannitol/chloroaromatic compound transport system permease large subunit